MGRPPKNQNASHITGTRPISSYFKRESSSSSRTRLIESYFQSSDRSSESLSTTSPSLGPLSSQEPEEAVERAGSASKSHSPVSLKVAKSDTVDSPTTDQFYDPFNSQDHGDQEGDREDREDGEGMEGRKDMDDKKVKEHKESMDDKEDNEDNASSYHSFDDDNNPFLSPEKAETSTEPDHAVLADPKVEQLSPEQLGLIPYSPKLSGESIRRLALSPRKQKKVRDLSPTSMPSVPMVSFSQRLAEEMGDFSLDLGTAKGVPTDEDAIVKGSDSESDAEWNDEDIFEDLEIKETMIAEDPIKLELESDEDIPSLRRFCGGRAPLRLDDSESDLEDSPFIDHGPRASTPRPTTTDGPSQNSDHAGGDSDGSDLPGNDPKSSRVATPRKPGGRAVRESSRLPASFVIPKQLIKSPFSASKRPTLFSLDSLLKEKERRANDGYDLKAARNKLALDEEILNELGDDEDEDIFLKPELIPKGILSEEQEETIADIAQEEQDTLVEDYAEFFVDWPQDVVVLPLKEWLNDTDLADHVVQKVLKHTQTESQRHQFLTSPFLMIMSSSPWTMPRSLFRWLVHIIAAEQNHPVTSSVFAVLQRILSQGTSLLGVDHQDLMRVYRMYGAKYEYLEQKWKVAPVTEETQRERAIRMCFSVLGMYNIVPETKKFPRSNLKAVVKLINITATLDPRFYDVVEIRRIINLLLRMTTDPIIGDMKSHIGAAIVALLDAIPADKWETERHHLCEEIIHTLGTSIPFTLLVLHRLPSLSMRITLLRRGIALSCLNQPPIPAGSTAPDLEELHRALFLDRGFLVNSKTNYYDLGRRVQVLSYCLDDEQMIAAYGRKALEPLMTRLRLINGKIVDLRAAFMDRTLAKDIIQRLYMRIHYSGIHRQASTQSTINFPFAVPKKNEGQDPLPTVPELPVPV